MRRWYSYLSMGVLSSAITFTGISGCNAVRSSMFPEYHKIEKYRGCDVIYDISGRIFVESSSKNMLNYLSKEDSDVLYYEILSLENKLEGEDGR